MFPFYTSSKHKKTVGFLVFSEGIKQEHRPEKGWLILLNLFVSIDAIGRKLWWKDFLRFFVVSQKSDSCQQI